MATNDFLPLGTDPAANVDSQATYLGWLARTTGFVSGIAPSKTFNKALRQATFMAAVIGQVIVDMTNQNQLDDGDVAGAAARLKLAIGYLGRIKLTANLNLYVATTGNDTTNSGLTSGSPFASLQKAWDTLVKTYDLNGFNVVINVANGTYTSGVIVNGTLLGQGAQNTVTFLGNPASPASCIITTTNAHCFYVGGTPINISGFSMGATGTYLGNAACAVVASIGLATITGGCVFRACSGYHMWAAQQAVIGVTAAYTISGGAINHILCSAGSFLGGNTPVTITLTGTPAFSGAFIQSGTVSSAAAIGWTFSGAATGTRYNVNSNSVINTNGGGINYFPGSIAGVVSSGGQYL